MRSLPPKPRDIEERQYWYETQTWRKFLDQSWKGKQLYLKAQKERQPADLKPGDWVRVIGQPHFLIFEVVRAGITPSEPATIFKPKIYTYAECRYIYEKPEEVWNHRTGFDERCLIKLTPLEVLAYGSCGEQIE